MQVVAVLASPREDGFSSTLAREVLRGAVDAGHQVVIYKLNEMNVKGCQGCRRCKDNNADCFVQDDLAPYWKELHESGALVVSSPNYASQVCGPMITYMNRHYCLLDKDWKVRIHPGIKLVGVFAQGNGDPEAYAAQYNWYLGDFQNRDMVLVDTLIHTGRQPLTLDGELMRRAYNTGKNL
ncbi:MAG: flavodoxin family protein [Anaerolineae bacterium]|nr:flavodoxin family protein [Anaerolineae bacterium]